METRRGFFKKIKSAIVGGAAVVAGIVALPEIKPVIMAMESTSKGAGDYFKHHAFTHADLEKAYNDAWSGGALQPCMIYMSPNDYERGLGLEV